MVQDLSKILGVMIDHRCCDDDTFFFASENLFCHGKLLDKCSVYESRDMYNIIASMFDKDGEVFRWDPISEKIAYKENERAERWETFEKPQETDILKMFKNGCKGKYARCNSLDNSSVL